MIDILLSLFQFGSGFVIGTVAMYLHSNYELKDTGDSERR